jgi:hypothetical protein
MLEDDGSSGDSEASPWLSIDEQGIYPPCDPFIESSNSLMTKWSIARTHRQGPTVEGKRLTAPEPEAVGGIEDDGPGTTCFRYPGATATKMD